MVVATQPQEDKKPEQGLPQQELAKFMPQGSPMDLPGDTPENTPGFGLPSLMADRTATKAVKSPSIDFMTEGMNSPLSGSAGIDPVMETDQLGQVDQNAQMAGDILLDPSLDASARVAKAREQLNTPPKKKLIGQIYMDMLHPGTPVQVYEQLSYEFSLKAADEEHKALMVDNLTEGDQKFADYAATPNPAFDEIMKQVKKDRNDSEFNVGNTLYDIFDYATPFFDPKNENDQLEVDISALASEILDVSTPFTFVDDKNAAVFEKRYGPEWRLRMFAWVAKEMAVDSAVLFAATFIPGLGPLLAVGSGATKTARFGRSLARAAVVSVGGGSIHATINNYIGRDPNLGVEVASGFVGTLGGEALVKLIGKHLSKAGGTLRKSMKAARRAAAGEKELPISKRIEDGVKDFRLAKDPMAVTEIKADLWSMSGRFYALGREIADAADPGLIRQEQELIAERMADITGYSPDQLTNELALGSRIFFDEELAPVVEGLVKQKGRTEAATAAEAALTKAKATKNKVKIAAAAKAFARAKASAAKHASLAGTGNSIVDRVLIGDAVGSRVMGTTAMRQNKMADELFAYVWDDKISWRPNVLEVDKRIGKFNILGRTTKWLKTAIPKIDLGEADQLPLNGIGKDYFDSLNLTERYVKAFQRALVHIDQGLSKAERREVDELLIRGSDEAMVYDLPHLQGNHSENVIDAYYATRSLLDMNHYVLNRAITAEAAKNGVEMLGTVPVNTMKKANGKLGKATLSAQDVKDGKMLVQEVASDGRKLEAKKVAVTDTSELTSMLPAHTGYLPRAYKNANHHVTVVDVKTGEMHRTHALPDAQSARTAAEETEAELGENSGKAVFYHKWDNVANTGEAGFSKNTVNILDNMSPEEREVLKASFVKAGIEDSDTVIKRILDTQDLTNMRKRFIGHRAEVPLRGVSTASGKKLGKQITALNRKIAGTEDKKVLTALKKERADLMVTRAEAEAAPLEDVRTSIIDYMMHNAKRAGADEWRKHAVDEVVKTYTNLKVVSPEGVTGRKLWYEDGFFVDALSLDSAGRANLKDALQMQKFLRRTVQNTSPMERRLNNWMTNTALDLADSDQAAKRYMSMLLDRMPAAQQLNSYGRGIGAVPKLLFGNVAQVAVQGSQALVTVGANPVHAAHGLADLMRATMAAIADMAGARVDRGSMHLLEMARQSGYLATLATNDLARIITHKSNPIMRGLSAAGTAPFKLGEATNRGLAFFTSRRKFMAQADRKVMNGIDDKPFKGKIDDAEFLRVVTDTAKVTALNMGKAGELHSLSGFNSVLFQFKQVLPKMTNIFESGRLSGREKLSAAAAMVGFWGAGAIPLIGDLVVGADYAGWALAGHEPSSREEVTQALRLMRKHAAEGLADVTSSEANEWGIHADLYERLIEKGAFNVGLDEITDSEWNIAHRVVLGRFITESYSASGSYADLVVATSVLSDLADFSKKSGIPLSLPNFLTVLYKVTANGMSMDDAIANTFTGEDMLSDYVRGERGAFSALVQGAKELGQAISYVGAVAKTVENSDSFLGFRYDIQDNKPGFGVVNPNQENFFTSSTGHTTNVTVTPGRLRQLMWGITPGALIEDQNARTLEMKYLEAVKLYRKETLEVYNNSTPQGKPRIIGAFISELEQLRTLLTTLRLKNVLSEDFRASSLRMFLQADLTRSLPKESPLESK